MPIYEYVCDECETHFEKIVINKQQEISCPKCASKKATIQLSVFATAGSGSSSSPSGRLLKRWWGLLRRRLRLPLGSGGTDFSLCAFDFRCNAAFETTCPSPPPTNSKNSAPAA